MRSLSPYSACSPEFPLPRLLMPAPMCPLQMALIEARFPLSAFMFPGTPDEFMNQGWIAQAPEPATVGLLSGLASR